MVYANPFQMCMEDLDEAIDHVPRGGGGVLQNYGWWNDQQLNNERSFQCQNIISDKEVERLIIINPVRHILALQEQKPGSGAVEKQVENI